METLAKENAFNTLAGFAEVLANGVLPFDRMPYALIKYQVKVFNESHVSSLIS